jgi:hypothetical protein
MALNLQPVAEALESLGRRTPVASVLRSAEWERVPVELRQRAQFSAGVESARLLQHVQDGLMDILGAVRDEHGVIANRGEFIARLGALAEAEGIRPTDPNLRGGIQDIGSRVRGEMIYDVQVQQAYGHANWKTGQSGDALEAAPAQELVRVVDSRVKRRWVDRWRAAGGKTFAGETPGLPLQEGISGIRLVALKTDPVWTGISRFGTPWPPFDFNSGMEVEDVLREEAEELGLIESGAPEGALGGPSGLAQGPTQPGFNDNLEAKVSGMQPELLNELLNFFGDQVQVVGDVIQWRARA